MKSHYEQVLTELKLTTRKLAKKYIPELYNILSNEEKLPHENCYAKVLQDCTKIWAEDTVRKCIPAEAKNVTKRKAGRMSAAVRERQRKNESLALNVNNAGQCSVIRGTDSSGDNSAGLNPTENGSAGRKEQQPRPEGIDKPSSYCAGCNEKSSSLEELRTELEMKDFSLDLLEAQVAELNQYSKMSSETTITFSFPIRFEELRSQMEEIFKKTNGTGNVWLNGIFDTKTMKIVVLTAGAAPVDRINDSIP